MSETTPAPFREPFSRKRRRYQPWETGSAISVADEPEALDLPAAPMENRQAPRYSHVQSVVVIAMRADGGPVPGATPVGISLDVSESGMQLLLDQPLAAPTARLVVGLESSNGDFHYEAVQSSEMLEQADGFRLRVLRLRGAHDPFSRSRCWPVFQPASGRFATVLPTEVLEQWRELGVLQARILDRILVCPQCAAVPTIRRGCQSCGSSRVTSARLIHHFACAHVAEVQQFQTQQQMACPKCQTQPLVVGADFEYLAGPIVCSDCQWSGAESLLVGQCLGCNIRFPLESSRQQEIVGYDVQRLDALDFVAAR